jgi:hypothetical protein
MMFDRTQKSFFENFCVLLAPNGQRVIIIKLPEKVEAVQGKFVCLNNGNNFAICPKKNTQKRTPFSQKGRFQAN